MIYSPVGHELISLHFCGLLFKLVPLLYDCDFIFSYGALVYFNVYAIFIHSLRFFAGSLRHQVIHHDQSKSNPALQASNFCQSEGVAACVDITSQTCSTYLIFLLSTK